MEELNLFVDGQVRHNCLQDGAHSDVMLAYKRRVVHIREHAHEESNVGVKVKSAISFMNSSRLGGNALAIHTIGHPAVAWDAVTEVLQVERTLKARGEEASEWRDERGEGCEDKTVKLELRVGN